MGLKIIGMPFVGYPVSDMKQARDFYECILGLTPSAVDHEIPEMPGKYWVEYPVGSQTLGISNAWKPSHQSGPSIALEVEHFQDSEHLSARESIFWLNVLKLLDAESH